MPLKNWFSILEINSKLTRKVLSPGNTQNKFRGSPDFILGIFQVNEPSWWGKTPITRRQFQTTTRQNEIFDFYNTVIIFYFIWN